MRHKTLQRRSKALLLLRRYGGNQYYSLGLRAPRPLITSPAKVLITIFGFHLIFTLTMLINTRECSSNPLRPCLLFEDHRRLEATSTRTLLTRKKSCLQIFLFLFLQTITLGLLRSDYFNADRNRLLQVEFNTIASSFGGISSKFQDFHR